VKVFIVSDMSRPVQQFAVRDQLPKGAGITAFEVLADGSKIVLGFTTGTILLYEGEFLRENTGRPPAPQVLMQQHTSLCSGTTLYATYAHVSIDSCNTHICT